MKKLLMIAIVASVFGMVFVSCGAGAKVFSLDAGGGVCQEITTNDSDMQDALVLAGYTEDACSTATAVGTCENYGTMAGLGLQMDYVFSTPVTAVDAEALCTQAGGDWTAN